MKTILTVKELSERWGISERTIRQYLADGILSTSNIPGGGVFFNLTYIENLEQCGDYNPMSPLERRKLLGKIEELESENNKCKKALKQIQITAMQTSL